MIRSKETGRRWRIIGVTEQGVSVMCVPFDTPHGHTSFLISGLEADGGEKEITDTIKATNEERYRDLVNKKSELTASLSTVTRMIGELAVILKVE